jgi:hypothetical protein
MIGLNEMTDSHNLQSEKEPNISITDAMIQSTHTRVMDLINRRINKDLE